MSNSQEQQPVAGSRLYRTSMAVFPRLKELREGLAIEVSQLAARMPNGRPSVASLYRLEAQKPIRLTNVMQVFRVINKELDGILSVDKEIHIFDQ